MKKCTLFFLQLFVTLNLLGQNKDVSAVVKEGKKLYRSEKASWHGTDLFLERAQEKSNNIGGYFSYQDNDLTKCIFFSQGAAPVVIGTISFDSTFNVNMAEFSKEERPLTAKEQAYFSIRLAAFKEIKKDKLFQRYQNTNFNVVPLVDELGKRVYVLTGSTEGGVVMFGNDYLIKFNDKGKVMHKSALHASLIPFNVKEAPKGATPIHSHLPKTGDLMTPTDICTTMLYQDLAGWKQSMVISENKVNIWTRETNQLEVMDKEAWEKTTGNKMK